MDFKAVLRQLENPEAHELYHNIAIDTLPWAWDLCTKYICSRAGVQNIADVGYGKLYKERDEEFKNCLRQITMLSFGLILLCHLKEKEVVEQISDDKTKEITYLLPDLDKRCLPIVNALVDLIGIGITEWDKDGKSHRYLLTRSTPTITAGSRFRFLDSKIPFSFEEVEAAVGRAKRNKNLVPKSLTNQYQLIKKKKDGRLTKLLLRLVICGQSSLKKIPQTQLKFFVKLK